MKNIINYEELEKPILAIETVLEAYDMEEKSLILNKVVGRLNAKKQKQMIAENTQTSIQSMSLKNVFKALRKKDEDDEKEAK